LTLQQKHRARTDDDKKSWVAIPRAESIGNNCCKGEEKAAGSIAIDSNLKKDRRLARQNNNQQRRSDSACYLDSLDFRKECSLKMFAYKNPKKLLANLFQENIEKKKMNPSKMGYYRAKKST
jgi:hypothetical protein